MAITYDLVDVVKNNDSVFIHVENLATAAKKFPHGLGPQAPRNAMVCVKGADMGIVRIVSIDAEYIELISDAAGGLDCMVWVLAGSHPIRASGVGI